MVTAPNSEVETLKESQVWLQPKETLSAPAAIELGQLLDCLVPRLLSYVDATASSKLPVAADTSPSELTKLLDLEFEDVGLSQEGLVELLAPIVMKSVRSWDPRFCDKLYASTNAIGVVAELVLAVLNANSHVYHVSPSLTLAETATAHSLAKMFGMGINSGGITLPGGSASNTTAMTTARNLLFPHIKESGYGADDRLSVFTSTHSHYSIEKAAIVLGIGSSRVYKVPCSLDGRMLPAALKAAIETSISKSEKPFFVNCTAGTTVLGSFDDIEAVAAITRPLGLWLHVDGSWGGPVVFSSMYRHLVFSSSLADSLTINPHKLLGVPVQCSFLLLQDKRLLFKANSLQADYLFHDQADQFRDLGNATMGCGRRPDAFKMYLAWKYYGTAHFSQRVTAACDNALYLAERIAQSPYLQLAFPVHSVNVCFWFRSQDSIAFSSIADSHLWTQDFAISPSWGRLTQAIQKKLSSKGEFMIDFAPATIHVPSPNGQLKEVVLPPFFRMVMNSPNLTTSHLDALVNSIESIGKELSVADV
ncbi:Glutamate decarboxylase 2 [Entomophthora muscae]|uniref:Glutamate decarboxylase 2 n=1 Tax=Entomophthora muscae TaxID=34485 RepID=A0ACC2U1N4_9FUNG|nr:Glutamate decarboxylase 2 [Entomophthora muscae]